MGFNLSDYVSKETKQLIGLSLMGSTIKVGTALAECEVIRANAKAEMAQYKADIQSETLEGLKVSRQSDVIDTLRKNKLYPESNCDVAQKRLLSAQLDEEVLIDLGYYSDEEIESETESDSE